MRSNGSSLRGRDLGRAASLSRYGVSRSCVGIPRVPADHHVPSGHKDGKSRTSAMQVSHGADPPLLSPCALPPNTIYYPLSQEKPCVVPEGRLYLVLRYRATTALAEPPNTPEGILL
jgi:hypothetical protein